MRDPEQMIGLLEKMATQPSGQIISRQFMGMSTEAQAERHHVELLVDAGLAEWTNWDTRGAVRITNAGYNFLDAIKENPNLIDKLKALLQRGMPIATAVIKILADLSDTNG